MKETERMGFDDALREAVTVKHLAKNIMPEVENVSPYQAAYDYLEHSKTTDPITRELLFEGANVWAQIEVGVNESEVMLLLATSREFSKSKKGVFLFSSLLKSVNDKEFVIKSAKPHFEEDVIVRSIFNSHQGLEEKWYEHFYITIKMVVRALEIQDFLDKNGTE